MLGNCFASAGMDNTVKIWALDTAEVQEAVRQSFLWTPNSRVVFKTCFECSAHFLCVLMFLMFFDFVL